jgi:hypothetical protein
MTDPRHRLIALATALLTLAAPAAGQGTQVFPPVPGPFYVEPMMPEPPVDIAAGGQPGATGSTFPGAAMAAPGPLFAPPANAMRLPYWMQPGQAGQGPQTAGSGVNAPQAAGAGAVAGAGARVGAAGGARVGGSAGAGGGNTANVGYGQATAPGAFPGYGATMPWAGPAQPGGGAGPGYGAAPQGYGYGAQPGWAAQPYMPAPGWGGWAGAPGGGN